MFDLQEIKNSAHSRRGFLKTMMAAGIGAAALMMLDTPLSKSGIAWGDTTLPELPNDKAAFPGIPGATINLIVLNFALTLEILEADLYRQALNRAAGLPLGTALAANPNSYTVKVPAGSLSATNAKDAFAYIRDFSFAEAAHRDFLKIAIKAAGGTPVSPNLGGYRFPTALPASLSGIEALLLPLEETGVRAYLGALPYLTSLSLAQIAGGIFSVEARHSATISQSLGIDPGPNHMSGDLMVIPTYPSPNALEYYLAPATVIQRASTYFA